MANYYTSFIGMRDTITEAHLLVGEQRTQLEHQLDKARHDNALLHEQLTALQNPKQHDGPSDHAIVEQLVEAKLTAILAKHGLVKQD